MTISHIIIIFTFIFSLPSLVSGQEKTEKKPKGHLYFTWGYNKDWYSRSNLHFESKKSDGFNFTVYDVTAHDRPNFDKVFVTNVSIPQFIYRLGYTFARHPDMGIEIAFDHAKYIMNRNTYRHVKGTIPQKTNNDQDTLVYVDKEMFVSEDFLRFEHTNGANFLMFNFFWKRLLLQNKSGKSELYFIFKPGAGIVIPQSEVAILNVDFNNVYHIAGYVTGLDLQMHYEYKKRFIFETGFKGVFANYLDVLSVADSKANHHFFAVEWLIAIGYQLPI